jgi:hypothetical protein
MIMQMKSSPCGLHSFNVLVPSICYSHGFACFLRFLGFFGGLFCCFFFCCLLTWICALIGLNFKPGCFGLRIGNTPCALIANSQA